MLKTIKKSRKVLIYGGLAIVFLSSALAITLFSNGYTLGSGFKLRAPGTIILSVPRAGSKVIIDDKLKTITKIDYEKVIFWGLSPRLHTILISQESFLPWGKNIIVKENQTVEISSFLAPANARAAVFEKSHPRYQELVNLILKSFVPTVSNPKIFEDGTIAVWVEGETKVMASFNGDLKKPWYFCTGEVCIPEVTVITTNSPVKNVDFYAKERDVIMIALEKGVYALELGKSGIQNFQPLYIGENPRFYKENENRFFVLDGKELMEIGF